MKEYDVHSTDKGYIVRQINRTEDGLIKNRLKVWGPNNDPDLAEKAKERLSK